MVMFSYYSRFFGAQFLQVSQLEENFTKKRRVSKKIKSQQQARYRGI